LCPHEFASKELGFRAGEPNSKITRKTHCTSQSVHFTCVSENRKIRTVVPLESVFSNQVRNSFRVDDPRVEILDRDIRISILLSKMLDDLVHSSFARAVANVARLNDLARSRGDIHNHSRAHRLKRQELLDDMEGPDDISVEGGFEIYGGDFFAWNKWVRSSDVRNEDVDLANLLENRGNAFRISDRSGVRGDTSARVFGFEGLLCLAEYLLTSLNKDKTFNASFGEGIGDGEPDATC
jgi:hypothetical protein